MRVCLCQLKTRKLPCVCVCDRRCSEQVLTQTHQIALRCLISMNTASTEPLLPPQHKHIRLVPGNYQRGTDAKNRFVFSLVLALHLQENRAFSLTTLIFIEDRSELTYFLCEHEHDNLWVHQCLERGDDIQKTK